MAAFFLTSGVNASIVSLAIIVLWRSGVVEFNPKWALATAALLLAYLFASASRDVIPIKTVFPEIRWNWGGKILVVLLWISVLSLLTRLKRDFQPADAGFTSRQNPASLRPAVLGMSLLILLQVLNTQLNGDGEHDTETLRFEALMPGLDEEPMFRGLLLYFLSSAIPSKRANVLGAQVNVAGLMLTIFFGLEHGLGYSEGVWHQSITAIVLTSSYGFILLWLRERTGSLLFPLVAHNTVNVASQFKFDF